jgi:mycothiol conjugate amidase Mca
VALTGPGEAERASSAATIQRAPFLLVQEVPSPVTLSLMAVHAHPDDEVFSTGGILARYAKEGVRTVLVTCTDGAVGEISDPALATPENLATVREGELRAASAILGVRELHMLGYRDSGMVDTPDNDNPVSFKQASLDEAIGKLVAIVRRTRPQVMVTYTEDGGYGHPDHIRAHQISVAAFDAAGDLARYPEQGLDPWEPCKLYYAVWVRRNFKVLLDGLREAGLPPPWDMEEGAETPGAPDEMATATVDTSAYAALKQRALGAHRTQIAADSPFLRLPAELATRVYGEETFHLAKSRIADQGAETDLFAGVRP